MALKVPTFVVITKIDVCRPAVVQHTQKILERILKSPGCKKVPLPVTVEDDVITAAANFSNDQ